jgi:hypothetical protein
MADERFGRLFFFFCGSLQRHDDAEFSRHDGEILLAKKCATAERRPSDTAGSSETRAI